MQSSSRLFTLASPSGTHITALICSPDVILTLKGACGLLILLMTNAVTEQEQLLDCTRVPISGDFAVGWGFFPVLSSQKSHSPRLLFMLGNASTIGSVIVDTFTGPVLPTSKR